MKIGIDFDGVIADCSKLKSDAAQKLYGFYVSPSSFKKELIVGKGYLTLSEYGRFQNLIYVSREEGLRMEPVPDVLVFVQKLLDDGHEVRVITSRADAGVAIAKEWASARGLILEFTNTGPGNSKAEAAQGLDIFVDDDFDKLENLEGIVSHRFLFSWKYNKHVDEGRKVKRVGSWRELYDVVSNLKGVIR